MKQSIKLVVLIALSTGLQSVRGADDDLLEVYVVNYTLQYFAGRIAGGHARVEFPAPRDSDPVFWKPSTATINDYQKADLILLNGAGYAKWLSGATLPRAKLVNTSRAFSDRYIKIGGEATHSHGPSGSHSHTGTAFMTWLDFQQAILQARAIAEELVSKRAGLKDTFEHQLDLLERELLAIDSELMEIGEKKPGIPLVASHPVYQYLARRYGLNLRSVQWEPREAPTDEQWAELAGILDAHPARWMIWESEPNKETKERLAMLGMESLVFNTGANVPQSGDWLDLMRENVDNLKRIL